MFQDIERDFYVNILPEKCPSGTNPVLWVTLCFSHRWKVKIAHTYTQTHTHTHTHTHTLTCTLMLLLSLFLILIILVLNILVTIVIIIIIVIIIVSIDIYLLPLFVHTDIESLSSIHYFVCVWCMDLFGQKGGFLVYFVIL